MKKYFVTLFLSVFCFVVQVSAQSSVLATLFHEGEVSIFSGSTALRQAHAAATHGDVITLSGGSFMSVDITKAVTIRGAGMEMSETQAMPTIITGDFTINVTDSVSQRLIIEGIFHNQDLDYENVPSNSLFLKCRLKCFNSYYSKMSNASFIHCKITEKFQLSGTESTASIINCVIRGLRVGNSNCGIEVYNSFVAIPDEWIYNCVFSNCILLKSSTYGMTNFMAYNCIGYSDAGNDIFVDIPNSTNIMVDDLSTVFKTYQGKDTDKLDSEKFELTDEAKSKYIGTDGTQVGIYGGSLPFDPTTTNPQIVKCNVAGKSTADGKLSVDIEVKAAE